MKLDEEITDALLNDIDPVFKADGLFKSVGEILDHGFAVKVNDTRWNNYFLNIDEEEDELFPQVRSSTDADWRQERARAFESAVVRLGATPSHRDV